MSDFTSVKDLQILIKFYVQADMTPVDNKDIKNLIYHQDNALSHCSTEDSLLTTNFLGYER